MPPRTPARRAPRAPPEAPRFDFHSHTFLTDGNASATDMWRQAQLLHHRALAVTDHLMRDDPSPLVGRLLQEAKAWEGTRFTTLVGVEISMLPPRQIADVARAARRAGAQIVIVHGETLVEPVYPGTNHAAIESGEVDLLAHPGLLSEKDAELAAAHEVVLELTARRGHAFSNGHVALRALAARAPLVLDSDAHATSELVPYARARALTEGAGVGPDALDRVLSETPRALLRRCLH
ncbi:MAG: histidinol phosphate phosphatase domain-containing protein [Thermoplasmata archaeon]|nr:histidinol phosphate phosphatase domain-containing protein [Thermoplasmata archaeon]